MYICFKYNYYYCRLIYVAVSGGARGGSGVALDTPDMRLATPGATPKFYLLLAVADADLKK